MTQERALPDGDVDDREELLRLRVSREGRVLIPAEVRRALGLEAGKELVGHLEDGRLVLETRANLLRGLQRRFAHLPAGVSLSAELIADRRREAIRDEDGAPG